MGQFITGRAFEVRIYVEGVDYERNSLEYFPPQLDRAPPPSCEQVYPRKA